MTHESVLSHRCVFEQFFVWWVFWLTFQQVPVHDCNIISPSQVRSLKNLFMWEYILATLFMFLNFKIVLRSQNHSSARFHFCYSVIFCSFISQVCVCMKDHLKNALNALIMIILVFSCFLIFWIVHTKCLRLNWIRLSLSEGHSTQDSTQLNLEDSSASKKQQDVLFWKNQCIAAELDMIMMKMKMKFFYKCHNWSNHWFYFFLKSLFYLFQNVEAPMFLDVSKILRYLWIL